MKQRNYIIRHA